MLSQIFDFPNFILSELSMPFFFTMYLPWFCWGSYNVVWVFHTLEQSFSPLALFTFRARWLFVLELSYDCRLLTRSLPSRWLQQPLCQVMTTKNVSEIAKCPWRQNCPTLRSTTIDHKRNSCQLQNSYYMSDTMLCALSIIMHLRPTTTL